MSITPETLPSEIISPGFEKHSDRLASHFCLTNALRWADATIVVPMDFIRIPLIAVIAWAVYGEPIDAFVFLGAGLIIAGVMWNLRAETRRR